jgi:hypothetical protein
MLNSINVRYLSVIWFLYGSEIREEVSRGLGKYCSPFSASGLISVLLGWLLDPDDGGDIFLRNVTWLSLDYTALYPRRQNSSQPLLWEPQIQEVYILYFNIVSNPPRFLLAEKRVFPSFHRQPHVPCVWHQLTWCLVCLSQTRNLFFSNSEMEQIIPGSCFLLCGLLNRILICTTPVQRN